TGCVKKGRKSGAPPDLRPFQCAPGNSPPGNRVASDSELIERLALRNPVKCPLRLAAAAAPAVLRVGWIAVFDDGCRLGRLGCFRAWTPTALGGRLGLGARLCAALEQVIERKALV